MTRAHPEARIEVGYKISKTQLQGSDANLDTLAYTSSVKNMPSKLLGLISSLPLSISIKSHSDFFFSFIQHDPYTYMYTSLRPQGYFVLGNYPGGLQHGSSI